MDERNVVRLLSGELDKRHRLITAQALERVGQQRLSRYRFRHNLFQHYLYHNLDEMERGYLHEAVGNVLEEMYSSRTAQIAVQLAWHFQEAGLVDKAIIYLQEAGDAATQIYAHTEAITAYRQALTLSDKHQFEVQNLSELYSRLGRALEINSQFEDALATYEEMERVARQRKDEAMALAALLPQVTLYVTPTPLHDTARGLALGQETVTLAREVGDQAAEAKTLWHLALAGMWGGRTVEGIEYGEQAAALARQLNLTELLAYALNDLGMLHLTLLDFAQAKATLYEARKLWHTLDNLPMLTDSMSMACGVHVLAGEYEQAITLSDEAFQISEASNNLWGQSFSRMILCWAYWELGQAEQALRIADESVHLGKQAGFVASQVLAGGYRAAMYGHLGDLDRGVELAQQAVAVAETQFPHFRCHPLGVLAQLHLLQGGFSEAEVLIKRGQADPYGAAHPAWNMQIRLAEIQLALHKNNYEVALAIIDEWLPQLQKNSIRTYIPTFLHLKGQTLQAMDQIDEARTALLQARGVAETLGAKAMLWPILVNLRDLESDPKQSQHLSDQARTIVEQIAKNIEVDELRNSFLSQPAVLSVA